MIRAHSLFGLGGSLEEEAAKAAQQSAATTNAAPRTFWYYLPSLPTLALLFGIYVGYKEQKGGRA